MLRVPVPSIQQSDSIEKFTIDFSEKPEGVDIILRWDTTKVIIPVK